MRAQNPNGTIDKGGRHEEFVGYVEHANHYADGKGPIRFGTHTAAEHRHNALNGTGNGIFFAGETRDMTLIGINSGSELDIVAGAVFYADGT